MITKTLQNLGLASLLLTGCATSGTGNYAPVPQPQVQTPTDSYQYPFDQARINQLGLKGNGVIRFGYFLPDDAAAETIVIAGIYNGTTKVTRGPDGKLVPKGYYSGGFSDGSTMERVVREADSDGDFIITPAESRKLLESALKSGYSAGNQS